MDHLNSPLYNDTPDNDAPTETQGLSWGRSYLMCPPDYFGVFYEINPWMHTENAVDQDRAQEQWHHLVANLRRAGATVKTMEPVKSLPDIVFTANAGLIDGRRFIPSQFTYPERQLEAIYDTGWFRSHDFEITEFSRDPRLYFEGCANSVVVGKTIIMPYCPPRVGRVLCKWGYEVCVSPVSEFVKAGGGVRCLTLALDVSYQNSG
jgi:N-dimethylarginine dimethylaminohydrolase